MSKKSFVSVKELFQALMDGHVVSTTEHGETYYLKMDGNGLSESEDNIEWNEVDLDNALIASDPYDYHIVEPKAVVYIKGTTISKTQKAGYKKFIED